MFTFSNDRQGHMVGTEVSLQFPENIPFCERTWFSQNPLLKFCKEKPKSPGSFFLGDDEEMFGPPCCVLKVVFGWSVREPSSCHWHAYKWPQTMATSLLTNVTGKTEVLKLCQSVVLNKPLDRQSRTFTSQSIATVVTGFSWTFLCAVTTSSSYLWP